MISQFIATLDSTSLFSALLMSHLAALVCSVAFNLVKETFKGAAAWIGGHALMVLAIVLTTLPDSGYSPVRIVGNIAYLAAAQLFILAMRQLRTRQGVPLWSHLLVAGAALFFLLAGNLSVNLRIVVFSAIFGLQFGYLFWITLKGAPAQLRLASWLTGFPFLCLALAMIARVISALVNPAFESHLEAGLVNKLLYLLSISTAFLLFFGYFLLTTRQQDLAVKRQQAEILEKNRQLEKLNQDNNTIISLIAHDLAAPLGSAKRLVQRHLGNGGTDGSTDDERRREIIQALGEYLEYSSDMVQKVLYWARSSRDSFQFLPVPTDAEFFARLQPPLSLQAESKGLQLSWDMAGWQDRSFHGDPAILSLLVHNLVRNAIKFTPRGGRISTRISLQPDGSLEFRVQDTGIGIEPAILEDILAGKRPGGSRGTEGENGSGLGLQLCRNFLQRTGGTLHATSQPGQGSTFGFDLPPAPAGQAGPPPGNPLQGTSPQAPAQQGSKA